jgi:LacI family transcriptional regulator
MMTSSKRATTLRDVATLARVSPFTVSAVLNGVRSNTRVSAETRERVERCARQLHYTPNASARGLVRRRSDCIGVLVGIADSGASLSDPYASGVLSGILSEAFQRKLGVTILPHAMSEGDDEPMTSYRNGCCDGVVLIAPHNGSRAVAQLIDSGFPGTLVAYAMSERSLSSVDVDNAAGIRLAVDHLRALGHHRIAHIAGNPDLSSAVEREFAFRAAMADASLSVPEGFVRWACYSGNQTAPVVKAMLALPSPPTAIVAANDHIALAVIQTASALGVDVPGQLSVTGFDDIPTASHANPSLTTIRQPLAAIGKESVRLLVASIAGDAPVQTRLAPELIGRASTARPESGIPLHQGVQYVPS